MLMTCYICAVDLRLLDDDSIYHKDGKDYCKKCYNKYVIGNQKPKKSWIDD